MAGPPIGLGQNQQEIDSWYRWAYGVLNRLGAPTSPTNIRTLWNWSIKESGGRVMRWNNPLNTTQNYPGAVSQNSVGVKRYPSEAAGVDATAMTLQNGRYGGIVQALKNSVPASGWGSLSGELGTWGSGANWLGWNATPPTPSANFHDATSGGSSTNSGNPVGDALSSALGGLNPLAGVAGAITTAETDFAKKVLYVVLMSFGGVLMLSGLVVLGFGIAGKSAPVRAVSGAAKGAAKGAVRGPAGAAAGTATGAASSSRPEPQRISSGGREIKVTNPESRARLRAAGVKAA